MNPSENNTSCGMISCEAAVTALGVFLIISYVMIFILFFVIAFKWIKKHKNLCKTIRPLARKRNMIVTVASNKNTQKSAGGTGCYDEIPTETAHHNPTYISNDEDFKPHNDEHMQIVNNKYIIPEITITLPLTEENVSFKNEADDKLKQDAVYSIADADSEHNYSCINTDEADSHSLPSPAEFCRDKRLDSLNNFNDNLHAALMDDDVKVDHKPADYEEFYSVTVDAHLNESSSESNDDEGDEGEVKMNARIKQTDDDFPLSSTSSVSSLHGIYGNVGRGQRAVSMLVETTKLPHHHSDMTRKTEVIKRPVPKPRSNIPKKSLSEIF